MPEKKQVIGIYGEMMLSMELHERGWQVYRGYIDNNVDFIITKYWCTACKKVSEPKKKGSMITNFCTICGSESLQFIERFIQVKTSEGISINSNLSKYSFHAKLRHNIDDRAYYAWIAVIIDKEGNKKPHYYIFHHTEINKFDDLSLDSYQETDNQKTTLRIDAKGNVMNQGRVHDYSCFSEFHNNFNKLEQFFIS